MPGLRFTVIHPGLNICESTTQLNICYNWMSFGCRSGLISGNISGYYRDWMCMWASSPYIWNCSSAEVIGTARRLPNASINPALRSAWVSDSPGAYPKAQLNVTPSQQISVCRFPHIRYLCVSFQNPFVKVCVLCRCTLKWKEMFSWKFVPNH